MTLTESRDYTQNGSPLPIKVSEVQAYFEMFYISKVCDREVILDMVQEMDRAYIAAVMKKHSEPETDTKATIDVAP